MRKYAMLALFLFGVIKLSAGVGLGETLFGDGNQEFICYTKAHRNFYLIIFFVFITLIFFIWSRYRLKKKSADELANKNAVIEEQNKDILSSIRYASRMQTVLQPDMNFIQTILSDSFFYLKPKDIVSGDFYFVDQSDDRIIIVAADCTGHGVPGAFLTIMGHTALRKVVDQYKKGSPTQLLDAMNQEVKMLLGQNRTGTEISDGMEVAMCVYTPSTNELQFAGAGRPLYLQRSGVFEEVKGLRCTVGAIQEHVAEGPPTHVFRLNKGDSFYIGSDGLADQFGGTDGKKFRSEQVRAMVRDIASLPMKEQLKEVNKRMDQWRGLLEQTDDMLLIGIRI
jgi:serine phosphatase RsbU (regulator of sigma subunit)